MNGGDVKDKNARLHKALSHPLRVKILTALGAGRVASPAELASELDAPLANISYHFQMLLRLDAIELVSTKPVRGALEHFYRATLQPTDALEDVSLPPGVRSALASHGLVDAWERFGEASEEGGLEDARSQVTASSLDLDEKGRKEDEAILDKAMKRVAAIQQEATKRLEKVPEDKRDSQRTELAVVHLMRNPKQD
jgi:DNA-binding transcriptional ArsR family regulator